MKVLKLSFELNIRKLFLTNAEDNSSFTILWVRGGKKIDTRTRQSKDGQTRFGEKFMMKTTLEYNVESDTYFAKPSQLQVMVGKDN